MRNNQDLTVITTLFTVVNTVTIHVAAFFEDRDTGNAYILNVLQNCIQDKLKCRPTVLTPLRNALLSVPASEPPKSCGGNGLKSTMVA